MKEKYWSFFIISLLVYGICLYLWWDPNRGQQLTLISLMVLVCLSADLLLSVLRKLSALSYICTAIMMGVSFYGFGINILVFAAIPVLKLTWGLWGLRFGILLTASLTFLICLIYTPAHLAIVMTVLILPLVFILTCILEGWSKTRGTLERKNEELNTLRKRINKQKTFAKTAEYTASLRERNRLATRIHDKIGHGISGNILLLEGAALLIKKDPVKSAKIIEQVTGNLREGVDDIRASLRDERTSIDIVGLSEIRRELHKLSATHNHVDTNLKTEGDMDEINPAIWVCIFENLKETLSNLIQHSTATKFNVLITNNNKLIRVEFCDNGRVEDFKADIGLNGIEERCAVLSGRCFFSADGGFKTVMIFKDIS